MNTHSIKMFLMLSLLVGSVSVTASAQSLVDDTAIQADVPFAFTVMDKTLPAGRYTVKRLNDTRPNVLMISSDDGHDVATFETESTQASRIPNKAELVFNKLGDQYFLSNVWTSDSSGGYLLLKTKKEKSLEESGIKTEHRSIFAKLHKRTKKGS